MACIEHGYNGDDCPYCQISRTNVAMLKANKAAESIRSKLKQVHEDMCHGCIALERRVIELEHTIERINATLSQRGPTL